MTDFSRDDINNRLVFINGVWIETVDRVRIACRDGELRSPTIIDQVLVERHAVTTVPPDRTQNCIIINLNKQVDYFVERSQVNRNLPGAVLIDCLI